MIPNLQKPSMFSGDGELRPSAGDFQVGAYIDLSRIDWPTAPGYGHDHARHMSQLIKHICGLKEGGVGRLTVHDCKILDAAAVLHSLGATPGNPEASRSASLAVRILTGPGNDWCVGDAEAVARLIYRQEDREAAKSDPVLQAFQDALRLEEARFKEKGRGHLLQVWKDSLFWTAWARDSSTLKTWLKFHKWF